MGFGLAVSSRTSYQAPDRGGYAQIAYNPPVDEESRRAEIIRQQKLRREKEQEGIDPAYLRTRGFTSPERPPIIPQRRPSSPRY